MDITEALDKDHNEALELASQICKEEEDAAHRRELFKQFKAALIAHSHAEESVVYDALKDIDDEEAAKSANEGYVEHSILEYLLSKMTRSTSTLSPSWSGHAIVLKELLEHHVEDERKEVFGMIREHFSESERAEMAESFERRKQKRSKEKSEGSGTSRESRSA